MKKQKVIMVGPSLDEKGGMGAVEMAIMNTLSDNLEIRHISTWDGEASQKSKLNMLKVFARGILIFLWTIFIHGVDVVHLHVSERGSVIRKSLFLLIAWLLNKPVIMHTHGSEFHIFHSRLPKIGKLMVNWVMQNSAILIVLSENWKNFYIQTCQVKPEKVLVLPNPVTVPLEVPERKNNGEIKISFLGKINDRKGVFDLLSAFALLPPEFKQKSRLIVAGSGEEEKADKLIKLLSLEENVELTGWLNSVQRDRLLAETDIFVLPSYNEGLPMALLEAMSWGIPVITTPVGGIPEVVTHKQNGLLVDPGDTEQLKVALELLVKDRTLRLLLGNAARQRVLPLDIKNYQFSLLTMYSSLLQQNRAKKLMLGSSETLF
ncbi:glycosyltransferase family 4 protein [Aerosakkonemataceae cyanobacterium BLCC-F154]|uniref:Glycosyltransferase family 4 protein n=1 Tax=Floridaenema fluviatile BLCC-F154 TaxID=3153640 RepID=A0ABV4YIL2_9CYAN